ncbi:MAG: prolipoprotein diacylglyceryl transferase [Parachlamydiaceae bacterium]|nr:prolipoprotein diacylglyceryl transferase [Parachlamydiaceae bacterium]
MIFLSFLSYIHWDPNPNLFTIPYLDHPLKWYGLLFMGGVVAGFLIVLPLLREKLLKAPHLLDRDIADWKLLRERLLNFANDSDLNSSSPFYELIDKQTRHLIQLQSNNANSTNNAHELSPEAKTRILKILSKIDREKLEEYLPGCIVPVKELCFKYVDGLLWWVVLGTIIGARLGHVFFYQWDYYKHHLSDIPKVWEGGLASHGGTLGVLLAVFFYSRWTKKKFPELNFFTLGDLLTIPTAFAVLFIRLGNFVNQEILGTPTTLPWGVIFGHPADGSTPAPRHPVQLYEALAYLLTFVLLLILWKLRKKPWPQGFFLGLFLICIFGSRFFLEYFKAPQDSILDESLLQAGQILSLPFIFFGAGLIFYSQLRSRNDIYCKQS